jgi:hypothetical protein
VNAPRATAVEFGHVVAGHGELDVKLYEDQNDARPFTLYGTFYQDAVDESFDDPTELLCYLATLVAVADDGPDTQLAVHSVDEVAVEGHHFIHAVTR